MVSSRLEGRKENNRRVVRIRFVIGCNVVSIKRYTVKWIIIFYNRRLGISKFPRTLIRIKGLAVQVKARLSIIFDEKL